MCMSVYVSVWGGGGNQPKLTREQRKCIYHLRPFNSNIFFVSCKKRDAEVKTATESCVVPANQTLMLGSSELGGRQ